MSLKETLSNSTTFLVINEHGEGAVVETETVFFPVYHVACRGLLSNRTFWTFI